MSPHLFLAGDIGGTNARFMLFEVDDEQLSQPIARGQRAPGKLIHAQKFMNQDFSSFPDVVRAFLCSAAVVTQTPQNSGATQESQETAVVETDEIGPLVPETACLAVAGPVKDNTASLTNREHFQISGAELQATFGIADCLIINDFLAVGYGLLTLDDEKECATLHGATRVPGAPIGCLGAGTGLGECYLTCASEDSEYVCFPTEGAHVDLTPRSDLEWELNKFLKKKFQQPNRVSVERIVSGPGIVSVYEFMASKFPKEVDKKITEKLKVAGDLKAAVVATHYDRNVVCRRAMDTFVTAYGAEAGNAALKWLPLGGLYVAGGLTPKNLHLLAPHHPKAAEAAQKAGCQAAPLDNTNSTSTTQKKAGKKNHPPPPPPSQYGSSSTQRGSFMSAFFDKGRMSNMLQQIPVLAVLTDDVGERGAHREAFVALQRRHTRTESAASKSSLGQDRPLEGEGGCGKPGCQCVDCKCGSNCACGPACSTTGCGCSEPVGQKQSCCGGNGGGSGGGGCGKPDCQCVDCKCGSNCACGPACSTTGCGCSEPVGQKQSCCGGNGGGSGGGGCGKPDCQCVDCKCGSNCACGPACSTTGCGCSEPVGQKQSCCGGSGGGSGGGGCGKPDCQCVDCKCGSNCACGPACACSNATSTSSGREGRCSFVSFAIPAAVVLSSVASSYFSR